MTLSLYFLRHGQTAHSEANLFCGSGSDPELTPYGVEMAKAFADAYKNEKFDAVYSSPLQRAKMTAHEIASKNNITPVYVEELSEISYGKWEGLSVNVVREKYKEDHERWLSNPAWRAPTGGESAQAVSQRSVRFVQSLLTAHPSGKILLVSHKATIRILLCSFLGIDLEMYRYRLTCPVASLSIVRFEPNGPMIEAIAERSHLSSELKNLPGT